MNIAHSYIFFVSYGSLKDVNASHNPWVFMFSVTQTLPAEDSIAAFN